MKSEINKYGDVLVYDEGLDWPESKPTIEDKLVRFRKLYNEHKEHGSENTMKAMVDYLNENEDLRIGFNRFLYLMVGEKAYNAIQRGS